MRTLATTREVIEALGGTTPVRQLVGAKSQQRVYNWIVRGRFPPETFPIITTQLAIRGFAVDPTLWRAVPVSVAPAAEPARAQA